MIGQTLNSRYHVTALIGEGAMGEVYRATDTQTGAEVAVKLLTQKLALEPDMVERFRREAEALRQLRHSNIVAFVDVFAVGKQQAIVMELVPGGSLHQLIQKGPLPVERVLRIALELCDALTRAHHLHIVHRDLKPENVLLAEDGTPKLTDFGVARLVSETTRLTDTGTKVGTPYYMSPEAWEGRELDEQADIWSLGVVLFEMLTGQVPFPGNTLVAVMNKVLTTPAPDLKKLRPETPVGLVKIIHRMLQRDKARRYPFMREVAFDLERVARGEAPDQTARKPAPPSKRVPRWVLGVAGISVAALAVVCLAAVGGLWWYTHRAAAPPASQTALSSGAFSTQGVPVLFAPTAVPSPTLRPTLPRTPAPPVTAPAAFTSSPQVTATPVPPGVTPSLPLPAPLVTLAPVSTAAISPLGAVNLAQAEILDKGGKQAAYTPDGKLLAVAWDKLDFYDAQTLQPLRSIDTGPGGWIAGFAFSPDGQTVALLSGGLKLYSVARSALLLAIPGTDNASSGDSGFSLAFSPDGKMVAVIVGETVKLFDSATGADKGLIPAGRSVFCLAFSPDGKQLVVGGEGLKVFDVATQSLVRSLGQPYMPVGALAISPDGRWLASAAFSDVVHIWDLSSGADWGPLGDYKEFITGMAFSPDGRLLATSSRDATVHVWDVANLSQVKVLTGHSQEVGSVAFSPDGETLVSTSQDQSTRLWKMAAATVLATAVSPAGPTPTPVPLSAAAISPENAAQLTQVAVIDQGGNQAGYSPDGKWLVVANDKLYLFDPQSLTVKQSLDTGNNWVNGFKFGPDSQSVALPVGDITVYNVSPFRKLVSLPRTSDSSGGFSVSYSPDGRQLAAVVGDTVKVYDAATGAELNTILAGGPRTIAFLPDGKRLAAGGWDSAGVWDVVTGNLVLDLVPRNTGRGIDCLAVSADGKWLAGVGSTPDNTIHIWDAATLQEQLAINNTTSQAVSKIAFSPDGRLLAATTDLTLSVWNAATGDLLVTLKGHTQSLNSVAFAPDGSALVTTSGDNTTRIWKVKTP